LPAPPFPLKSANSRRREAKAANVDQTEKTILPDSPSKTAVEPALSREKQAQQQRLAEALRANLRRRKAQLRQRKAGASEDSGA
jgi:hypothetical protein